MRVLGDIARLNAKRFGDETALIFEEQALSFSELNACGDGIGRRLLEMGVRIGDRVALLAENCLEFFPIYFGIMKIGAVMVPLNYRCTVAELEHMLRDSTPCVLFHTCALATQAHALYGRIDAGFRLVEISRALLDTQAPPVDELPADFDERATATIMYTSGTTGTPKGAMLPHRALLEGTAATALAARIQQSDRVVVTVPLFHGGGMYVVSHPHLYVGASIVLTARFEPDELFDLIERRGVTTFFGVPAQYAALLDRRAQTDARTSLRSAWYGGAPMSTELTRRVQALWPGVQFQQCYGQTETTLISVLGHQDHDRKMHTVGRELPHLEVRVVDEQGDDCPTGVIGEIVVNKNAGMTGYFNNPVQTTETIRDGWIHTGDLGFIDGDRFLTLVDRKKDMIISGGENVYPKEIEEAIFEREGVVEVAVVGAQDAKWGEVPVGFVVVGKGSGITASELQSWCEERLARYKVPRQWRFVDELPRTANGKVRKTALRDLLRESVTTTPTS
ncbi:class I adenylate-forming enzyme family protein [Bradyrhizobium genosp. A]|uniref:class I adenylate-forming enzyme family protein n=1 Tax=Bradyrhizobium genosp. A TaxID=83626 RepID=UPI003CEE804F